MVTFGVTERREWIWSFAKNKVITILSLADCIHKISVVGQAIHFTEMSPQRR